MCQLHTIQTITNSLSFMFILKIIYSPDHRIKMHLIRGLIFNREESDTKDILKKRLRRGNFRFVVRTILAHPGPHIERYPVFVFTKEIRLHLGKNSIHFKRQPFAVVRRLLVESTCADIISRHLWLKQSNKNTPANTINAVK
jgi:hypothetical protein